jgi:hypothetical protein
MRESFAGPPAVMGNTDGELVVAVGSPRLRLRSINMW